MKQTSLWDQPNSHGDKSERGHGLPREWRLATFEDISESTQIGLVRSQDQQSSSPPGYPYIKMNNITNDGRIDLSHLVYVNASIQEAREYTLSANDILFNTRNSAELVGKSALTGETLVGYLFNNNIMRIRLPDGLDSGFIAYQMCSPYFKAQLERVKKATTSIAAVYGRDLVTLKLVIAPSNEQRRIRESIDSYLTRLDAATKGLKRVEANLKRYRSSVLQAAVEGRLVPTEAELAKRERRHYEPAAALLELILKDRGREMSFLETEALPRLPEGWQWTRMDVVGTVQLGRQRAPQHHTGEHMRPYLRVANVFEDRIDTSDILTMNFSPTEYETYRLEAGDILLNEGQSLELVGRPAMYNNEVPGACFQNTLVRFRVHAKLNKKYALIVFRAYLHNGRFQQIAKWTTNIAHLGAGRFALLEFPLPPLNEQDRIVEEVERLLSLEQSLQSSFMANEGRLTRLRQSILKWAFEGKLVDQDPTDEPASVLLERIRKERAASSESSPKRGRPRKAAEKSV